MIFRIFDDGRLAEIVLDRSATTKRVLDAMDLVRLLLAHDVTVAKITERNPHKKARRCGL